MIEAGQIIEQGSFDELIEQKGAYYQQWMGLE